MLLLALPRVTMCQLHSSCQLWSPANKMHCRRQLPSFPASNAPRGGIHGRQEKEAAGKWMKISAWRIKSRLTILMDEGWMKGEVCMKSKLSFPLIENLQCCWRPLNVPICFDAQAVDKNYCRDTAAPALAWLTILPIVLKATGPIAPRS